MFTFCSLCGHLAGADFNGVELTSQVALVSSLYFTPKNLINVQAAAIFRREKYRQQALSVKTTGLKFGRDNQGARLIWQRMLQESRNISSDVAAAIVTAWPSPLLLYQVRERERPYCSRYAIE